MIQIPAIETIYDGYKFRSRLEARWAVFFNEAGIKYLYEHEGFDLPSGRYLPDFYLPDFEMFYEVKDESKFQSIFNMEAVYSEKGRFLWLEEIPLTKEKILAKELSEVTDHPVQIVYGDPVAELERQEDDGEHAIFFGHFIDCCFVMIEPHDWLEDRTFCPKFKHPNLDRIKAAALAARQARFEHGQSGARR